MYFNALIPSVLIVLSLSVSASAQLSLAAFGTAYVIDFDSTVAGVNNGAFAGLGFKPEPTSGQLDSDAWAVTGFSDGALVFGGTRITSNTDFTRGSRVNSAASTGGLYAFSGGNITTGRALGVQPTAADFAPGTLTLKLENATGSTIQSLDLSYVVYVRNDQDRSSTFNFSHSGNDSTYTPVAALDLASAAASDSLGFVANSRATLLTGLNIPSGGNYYLRWSSSDLGGTGSRDEFGLDQISITPVPEPREWALLVGGGLMVFALARKRGQRSCMA